MKVYNEALPLSRAVDDKGGEANTLSNIGGVYFAVNPGFAVFYGKQSVNIYQILRSNMQELDESVQQAFLKSNEIVYRELADALTNQQRFTEAQQVLDFRQFAPLAFTTLEAGLTATFNQKLETLAAAIRALDEYKRGIGERAPTADEAAQLQSLADEQTAANDVYLAFLKLAEREFAAPPTEQVEAIAGLPSKEELVSKLMFVINAQAQRLVTVINAVPRNLAVDIKQIKDKFPDVPDLTQ